MRIIIILFLMGFSFALRAQVIDNTASYRNIGSDKYFRIHYENDYFSETDEFYTQGINLEYVNPNLGKIPVFKILINSSVNPTKKGVALEHIGFTPTSISHNEVLYGDRPFAAALYLKTFSIITDTVKKLRLISILSTGIIGPGAGGKEMQQTIHRWIGDVQPLGWQNQIANDLVLNYQIDLEKNILSLGHFLDLNMKGGVMAGTLFDKAFTSAILMTGIFQSPFSTSRARNFQVYLYAEPKLNIVGYDATLQGGLFNKSPYVIKSNEICRVVFQNNFGIVFEIKKLNFEYFQSYTTQEFAGQGSHYWGGLRIGYEF